MDAYTAQTREWLNARFRKKTADGVYLAHQNIYGFKSPYTLDGTVLRYVIFYNITRALRGLTFDSALDVGGAEGYMAAAIRHLFGARVRSCDLSDEACKRAKEIFHIEADPADATTLPYESDSFDVVLCSESIEHMTQYEAAVRELLRVARKAVVITVPHDGPEAIAANIRNKVAHGHLHDFTLDSFRDLPSGARVACAWGLWSSILRLPFRLVEGSRIDTQSRTGIRRVLVRLLNPLVVAGGRVLGRRSFKLLLRLDGFLANRLGTYRQLVFVIVKDGTTALPPRKGLPVDEILDFRVPLHVMR